MQCDANVAKASSRAVCVIFFTAHPRSFSMMMMSSNFGPGDLGIMVISFLCHVVQPPILVPCPPVCREKGGHKPFGSSECLSNIENSTEYAFDRLHIQYRSLPVHSHASKIL